MYCWQLPPQIVRKLPTAYQLPNKAKGTVRQMEKPYRPLSQRIVMSASDPYPYQTSVVWTPLYINRGFCKIGKVFPIFLSPKRKNQCSAHIYSFIFVQDNILFELLLCDLDSITHHVNGQAVFLNEIPHRHLVLSQKVIPYQLIPFRKIRFQKF